jgi:hypothetical protein
MTPRTPFLRVLTPALVTVPVLLAACGGDDAGGGGLVSGDDYSIEAALGELPVPDDDDGLMITTADLATATELAGLERPSGPDAEAAMAWASALTGVEYDGNPPAPLFVPVADVFNLQYLSRIADFDAEVGWSLVDADAYVEATSLPERFAVIAGDFDESPLADDLTDLGDGVYSAGDGEDFSSDPSMISAARPIGAPIRLAYEDGLVAASPSTPAIEAWLSGDGATLADDERLTAVAAALDDAGAVSAVLVSGGSFAAGGVNVPPDAIAELDEVLPADPFQAVGIGWSISDEASGEGDEATPTATVTVAYRFATEAAAEASLAAFEAQQDSVSVITGQPLSELVTLQSAEQSGQVAVVTLGVVGERAPNVVYQMLIRRDLPFLHR